MVIFDQTKKQKRIQNRFLVLFFLKKSDYRKSPLGFKKPSPSLKLIDIDTGDLKPSFSKDITQYHVDLPYSKSTINIKAETNDAYKIIKIDDKLIDPKSNSQDIKLDVGENIVTVSLHSKGEGKIDYNVIIHRSEPNDNNELETLSISQSEMSPVFNSNTDFYSVNLESKEDRLAFIAMTSHELSNLEYRLNYGNFVKIDPGIEEVVQGLTTRTNLIEIKVTAENGDSRLYSFEVYNKSCTDSLCSENGPNLLSSFVPEN